MIRRLSAEEIALIQKSLSYEDEILEEFNSHLDEYSVSAELPGRIVIGGGPATPRDPDLYGPVGVARAKGAAEEGVKSDIDVVAFFKDGRLVELSFYRLDGEPPAAMPGVDRIIKVGI
jgi:hypothetical protein